MLLAGRSHARALTAGALLLGGSLAQRFAVFHAGFASASDPRYTITLQRRRLEREKAAAS
jgi:hypothetical protein